MVSVKKIAAIGAIYVLTQLTPDLAPAYTMSFDKQGQIYENGNATITLNDLTGKELSAEDKAWMSSFELMIDDESRQFLSVAKRGKPIDCEQSPDYATLCQLMSQFVDNYEREKPIIVLTKELEGSMHIIEDALGVTNQQYSPEDFGNY